PHVDPALCQKIEQPTCSCSLARFQRRWEKTAGRIALVQAHENIEVKLVVGLSRGDERDSKPLARDLAAHTVEDAQGFLDGSSGSREVALVTFQACDGSLRSDLDNEVLQTATKLQRLPDLDVRPFVVTQAVGGTAQLEKHLRPAEIVGRSLVEIQGLLQTTHALINPLQGDVGPAQIKERLGQTGSKSEGTRNPERLLIVGHGRLGVALKLKNPSEIEERKNFTRPVLGFPASLESRLVALASAIQVSQIDIGRAQAGKDTGFLRRIPLDPIKLQGGRKEVDRLLQFSPAQVDAGAQIEEISFRGAVAGTAGELKSLIEGVQSVGKVTPIESNQTK